MKTARIRNSITQTKPIARRIAKRTQTFEVIAASVHRRGRPIPLAIVDTVALPVRAAPPTLGQFVGCLQHRFRSFGWDAADRKRRRRAGPDQAEIGVLLELRCLLLRGVCSCRSCSARCCLTRF
jgi:hypothetical protein